MVESHTVVAWVAALLAVEEEGFHKVVGIRIVVGEVLAHMVQLQEEH
jgi:hypothetical protein